MTQPIDTATDLLSLIESELSAHDEVGKRIVANRLLAYLKPFATPDKPATPPILEPMTDVEARRYGDTRMSFGQYDGVPISDVPLDYLEWLSDSNHTMFRNLHRYLNSPAVKRQREERDK